MNPATGTPDTTKSKKVDRLKVNCSGRPRLPELPHQRIGPPVPNELAHTANSRPESRHRRANSAARRKLQERCQARGSSNANADIGGYAVCPKLTKPIHDRRGREGELRDESKLETEGAGELYLLRLRLSKQSVRDTRMPFRMARNPHACHAIVAQSFRPEQICHGRKRSDRLGPITRNQKDFICRGLALQSSEQVVELSSARESASGDVRNRLKACGTYETRRLCRLGRELIGERGNVDARARLQQMCPLRDGAPVVDSHLERRSLTQCD